MQKILTGNEAVAEAMRQIEPDVVAAYPITPSTKIPEKFSEFVANGKVRTEFVAVESEHSAMSACIGAAAAGARAMTATASQGLALMHEVLVNAGGLRLPIVLANANRALSAPLSIHGDHSDVLLERDSGWIQIFAGSPQEAYDLILQAFPIAEKVRLPVMICFDGFETSHLATNVEILSDAAARKFVGQPPKFPNLFDFEKPLTLGGYTSPEYFFEAKRGQFEAFETARKAITEVGAKFGKKYATPIEEFETKDAEIILVVLGSAAGAAQVAARNLRKSGRKVGVIRVRTFRPFPAEEILAACVKAKKIGILDRMVPLGSTGGVLFNEINSALFSTNYQLQTSNWIYGIGQRQFNPEHATEIFTTLAQAKFPKINFVNLRG
ncbi:MAG: transketolase C-terminal domain-containing protein [Patescibacteria group bacterium]|jgi:pyruvate ferredoxin oxidoreductase alpha subunit